MKVTGTFRCKVIDVKTGKVIREIEEKNLVVNQGKNIIARFLGDGNTGSPEVTKIGFGVTTNAPAPSDDEDEGNRYPFIKALDSIAYPSTGRVDFLWSLEDTENNGTTIADFGLLCEDERLFARRTHAGIIKNSTIRLEGTWSIQV